MLNSKIKAIAFNAPNVRFSGSDNEYKLDIMRSASALIYLMLEARQKELDSTIHTRIVQNLKNIIIGGKEPCIDAQHYWSYPLVTSCICLAKLTPLIWCEFTDEEKEKFDTLMTGFAVMSNYISNDKNHYKTGLNLKGDVYKHWNPNYKLSLVIPIIACGHYFGGNDELDDILINFDYDEFIAKCTKFGFKNILDLWTRETAIIDNIEVPGVKEMLLNKGNAYVVEKNNVFDGGKGYGVHIPYLYNKARATDYAIVDKLLNECYNGGPVCSQIGDESDYDAYILGGLISPVEGMTGMFKEFNGVDAYGVRSDAHYCALDFTMVVYMLATLKELGVWDETLDSELYQKICVGNTDLIFKLETGYMSNSNGKQHIVKENNLFGYEFAKDYWLNHFEASVDSLT